jgi:hypothetical protein
MTESGPQLRSTRLWATREARCLAIVERALTLLGQVQNLPMQEIDLNRQLYFCLLKASRELFPKDQLAPLTECNNQPAPDDEVRAKREQKRPDFQWVYLDRYEESEESSKQFVVECKRLGKAPRADWIINLNYANHGINRFLESEWAYAKRAASGAMVGYWQSMEAGEILLEVNNESNKKAAAGLVLIGEWTPKGVSRLGHTLDRTFEISPFTLHHLWIDLRANTSP